MGSDKEAEEEEPMVFLDRTTRGTRGKRMTKLLDDEVEEDEQFWNQEALKEEPEPEAVAEHEKEERDLPKKRLIYPGKTAVKKKKKKIVSTIEDPPGDEKPGKEFGDGEEDEKEQNEAQEDMEGEKVIRKSTRTSVVVRQAERDALRTAIQATSKPIQRKKVGDKKQMTQEEMLLEAAQTGLNQCSSFSGTSDDPHYHQNQHEHEEEYSSQVIPLFSKAIHRNCTISASLVDYFSTEV